MFGRGFLLFEITDEANADRDLIDGVVAHVTTFDLAKPAGANLDLAVARIDAVADDEVVGEAVFHAAGAVGFVVDGGVAVAQGTVVADDHFPATGFDLQGLGCGADFFGVARLGRQWTRAFG